MRLRTIGFTKKTAEYFFELLKKKHVKRLVDIRLNNVSQLAGFAKKKDLEYFLDRICEIDYVHDPLLAPTQDILDDYKKHRVNSNQTMGGINPKLVHQLLANLGCSVYLRRLERVMRRNARKTR